MVEPGGKATRTEYLKLLFRCHPTMWWVLALQEFKHVIILILQIICSKRHHHSIRHMCGIGDSTHSPVTLWERDGIKISWIRHVLYQVTAYSILKFCVDHDWQLVLKY